MNIRWEGNILIVEMDGKEMRFENAYVKDPPVESEPEPVGGMVSWKSEVKLSQIQEGLEKLKGKKSSG